jgi:hypothetical protein
MTFSSNIHVCLCYVGKKCGLPLSLGLLLAVAPVSFEKFHPLRAVAQDDAGTDDAGTDDDTPTFDQFLGSIGDFMADTDIPIFLPSRLPHLSETVYVELETTSRNYRIVLESTADCDHANACFLGLLTGDKGRELAAPEKLRLADGSEARFEPSGCGGSCSPPSIEWKKGDVVYGIQLVLSSNDEKKAKAVLTQLANEAIAAGPRH